MYTFIFYFFCTIYKKKNDGSERLTACIYTWTAQFIHILLLLGIIKYIYFISTDNILGANDFTKTYFGNKLYGVIFIALPWIIILFRYYNKKRISKIEQKYLNIKILTFKNTCKILLLMVVPLIIVISIAIITTIKNS